MVSRIEEPMDIGEEFRKETQDMMKKIAFENNCSVEELKFTANSEGIVNIQKMTVKEMEETEEKRQKEKLKRDLLKIKRNQDG